MAAFNLWLLYGYGARLTEDEHLEGAVSHEVSRPVIQWGPRVLIIRYTIISP